MEKRAIIQFNYTKDIGPIIEKWATKNAYILKESNGNEKLDQKGVGFLVAPMLLKVIKNESSITMEAWIRASLPVRIMSFFILPAEITIKSGGFKAVIPRDIARKAVNELLLQLGQPLIQ